VTSSLIVYYITRFVTNDYSYVRVDGFFSFFSISLFVEDKINTYSLSIPFGVKGMEKDDRYIPSLPNEILFRVFQYLPPEDICMVSQSCQQFNLICCEERIWVRFGSEDWEEEARKSSWKQSYLKWIRSFSNIRVIKKKKGFALIHSRSINSILIHLQVRPVLNSNSIC